MDNSSKKILLSLNNQELKDFCQSLGMPSFTYKQILEWLYKKKVSNIEEMSNLSKANRSILAEHSEIGRKKYISRQISEDGTKKYLFQVKSGFVEAVYIPEDDRATLCISSQVGCKMNCLFCQTGKQGFSGNLSVGDIINQVLSVDDSDKLTNIVFMGMGEPMDNIDNVMRVIDILTSSWGLAWSPKRITVSTIGVKKGLQRFLEESKCHLAISLHNPFVEERIKIMPSEKGFSIKDVLQLVKQYDFSNQRRVSIEYILFDGINDTDRHIRALGELLKGVDCRINLIPFHQIPDVPLRPSAMNKIISFQNGLSRLGYTCTIRKSRGQDIDAACGMLSTKEPQRLLKK